MGAHADRRPDRDPGPHRYHARGRPGEPPLVLGRQPGHLVRRIFHDRVIVGFAGSVADAFSLCDRFEEKMQMYGGSLSRAAVALAQDWRNDKVMRKLEAMMIVADHESLLIITGTENLTIEEV